MPWYNPASWLSGDDAPVVDEATLQRYAPGGDIFSANASAYGISGANSLYEAFRTGGRPAVSEAVAKLKGGAPGSTSTFGNFFDQITTDPLAAPIESANRQIGNVALNVLKNPWVLLVLILATVYLVARLGGLLGLKKRITG